MTWILFLGIAIPSLLVGLFVGRIIGEAEHIAFVEELRRESHE